MKHSKYIQHGLDGPYTPTRPSKADQVIFWLSGFVCGLIFALLITGN